MAALPVPSSTTLSTPPPTENIGVNSTPTLLPRPAWLLSGAELESLIATAAPSIRISLYDLTSNKNNSDLVEAILQRILNSKSGRKEGFVYGEESPTSWERRSARKGSEDRPAIPKPSDYELLLARLHLAVEVQSIMVQWCLRGLEETKRTNLLTRGVGPSTKSDLEISHGNEAHGEDEAQGRRASESRMDVDMREEHDGAYERQGKELKRARSTSTTSSGSCSTSGSGNPRKDINQHSPTHSFDRQSKRVKAGECSESEFTLPKLSLVTSEYGTSTSAYTSITGAQNTSLAATNVLKRKRDDLFIATGNRSYSPSASMPTPSSAVSPRTVRLFSEVQTPSSSTGTSEKSPYLCPFFMLNSNTHKECDGKKFPNPRKLKEHIWRYTKPFKCPVCNEGFGREKTKAIHCQQRKTPCKPRPTSEAPWDNGSSTDGSNKLTGYERSKEERRDKKIEAARTTLEIVLILQEYEKEIQKETESSTLSASAYNSKVSFENPFSNNLYQQSANPNSPRNVFSQPMSQQQQQFQVPEIVVQQYDVNAKSFPDGYVPQPVFDIVQFRSPSPAPIDYLPQRNEPTAKAQQGWTLDISSSKNTYVPTDAQSTGNTGSSHTEYREGHGGSGNWDSSRPQKVDTLLQQTPKNNSRTNNIRFTSSDNYNRGASGVSGSGVQGMEVYAGFSGENARFEVGQTAENKQSTIRLQCSTTTPNQLGNVGINGHSVDSEVTIYESPLHTPTSYTPSWKLAPSQTTNIQPGEQLSNCLPDHHGDQRGGRNTYQQHPQGNLASFQLEQAKWRARQVPAM